MKLLSVFAHHKVAANLLMMIMILAGVFALNKLNIQFFPTFELDRVSVRVIWSGASAEDVEEGITIPLEQSLKSVDHVKHMTSTSAQNVSSIQLEFNEGTDMILALDKVKQKVDEFRNLPKDAEKPQVENLVRYEGVAKILLSGLEDLSELRILANQFERELTSLGIDKVEINGLPDEQVNIEIPIEQLQYLEMTLDEISARINTFSQDMPAGTLGSQHNAKELRSLEQARSEMEFSRIPIVSNSTDYVRLGDVAVIKRQPDSDGVLRLKEGKTVAELALQRTEDGNAIEAAEILQHWLAEKRATLPPNIKLEVFDASWQLIRDRIYLLVKNGGTGLILVILILYLFLNARVAFWVALGIPVSFMATLAILYAVGGTINMISLFGLIMALGIIVDDAIVVGEDALTHYQGGEAPLMAAEGGARRMFVPVIASSLTTIAAFLPLMMIGGIMGNILFDIPLIVICVILASLVESFFVLPGHLRNAFSHIKRDVPAQKDQQPDKRTLRIILDDAFDSFRQNKFRKIITWALNHRSITIALAFSSLIVTAGLLIGGRINFTFFPSPEAQIIYANASFVSGTSREQTDAYLRHMEEKLNETNEELGGHLVDMSVTISGSSFSGGSARKSGDQLGAIFLQLVESDQRSIRNTQFIQHWKNKLDKVAGMDNLTIVSRKTGPQGSDLAIRLNGSENKRLKQAATELSQALRSIEGVYGIDDDMPYGKEQLIYSLKPTGEILGLTVTDIGRQLRTAFDGNLVQIFQDGADEVEVRVQLPKHERDQINTLERINIRTPAGEFVPLTSVAHWTVRHGFEVLRHAEGKLALEVSAEVNPDINNVNHIIALLEEKTLPELKQKYWIDYSLEGRAADQKETMLDMKWGGTLGLTLIYIVLAWVFSSYGWPLVVMAIIPFGLVGALWGHWIQGIDLTLLSIFGFFGLSGIVVNDSIILVSFYKRLRDKGMLVKDALIEASVQRLRAVLLTSLTTIAGLLPLLFETSLQAQFLIPMAVSIAFGLAFATVLVLIIIPVFLSIHESIHFRLRAFFVKEDVMRNNLSL
ncbi:MAG: efflux RND transporter permease subunit [gamma proteobacterium symbiont of Bathyaustriella thionipta]|nr:efflux RND transporter permease subunit [gamma proteobacterium symbiont of Bathyaustriella thionipta]MCU7949748.1 efflux RND transporter permease subunit [gamma proteobacterium symbiont of Bathyaustriella thionipta]MCU7952483.1 efflux RND transporter permease subunit [gamma proteobacterium symbiont of Bathyaustriella thionipta]MCU7956342.1 efflux RND transporter permease subunit [gamma proteobacterium symbiont of Bathyaustriella thionipta]MCU7965815.1 efflux RND transporter permease subunit 